MSRITELRGHDLICIIKADVFFFCNGPFQLRNYGDSAFNYYFTCVQPLQVDSHLTFSRKDEARTTLGGASVFPSPLAGEGGLRSRSDEGESLTLSGGSPSPALAYASPPSPKGEGKQEGNGDSAFNCQFSDVQPLQSAPHLTSPRKNGARNLLGGCSGRSATSFSPCGRRCRA
jgi:hypothetical protein